MGFITRHKERDSFIPKHRQTLIHNIKQDLLNEDQVLSVFFGGSIGNKNTDMFSDIDLRVVVKEEAYENFRINKKQRSERWGNVIYHEDFPWANYTIAHYDCFIKVDTFYYKPRDIKPSEWLKNIKIVHDTNEIMEDIVKLSMNVKYRPTIEEVELWRTKFFSYFHETYRRVMRNELYYALQCIDSLRLSMTTAWCMDAEIQPNTFGDWAKLEGDRSKFQDWQLSLLESWDCSRNPSEIVNVMRCIIPEFKQIHKRLCEKVGIDENPDWVDQILHMVI